jgi:hypothetical protein
MKKEKKDLRINFFNQLLEEIEKRKIDGPILNIGYPNNGETIKLNGIVLFKILRLTSKWNTKGIAIYKNITDSAIKKLNAERSNDKKRWVGCYLAEENYDTIMRILLSVVDKIEMISPKTRIRKENQK